MRRLAIALPLLLFAGTTASHAQEGPRVTPPRGLVTQLIRDLDPGDDLAMMSRDEVRAGITVQRTDLNGDGVPEYFVEGSRTCGTNCERWVYWRLPGGGYRGVNLDWVTTIGVLPARSHGWHSLFTWYHLSCCEGARTLYEFDGSTYTWRESKWQRDRRGEHSADTTMRTIYRVSITPPGTTRRRLRLDPVTDNGTRIDAGYDVCRRGLGCGEPWLRLASAQLPAGRVCVTMHTRLERRAVPYDRSWTDCGVTTTARTGGRTVRTLVLHPTRPEWGMLWVGYGLRMSIPGVRGDVGDPGGVSAFAARVSSYYRVVCPEGYGCEQ